MPYQQRIHGGRGRHVAQAIADDVNNCVAIPEIAIELLKSGCAQIGEVLLRADFDAAAFNVLGEQFAMAAELVRDHRKK